MRSITKIRGHRPSKSRLVAASNFGLETLEVRQLLTTNLATWAFDTLPGNTSLTAIQSSPAQTSGSVTGTAYTVGMQSGTAGGYVYPASGAASTADASTFLAATGTADTGGNGGSEGGTNGFVWRVESGQDSASPIASQGVQVSVPTTGQTGINVSFDLNPSSTGAVQQFMVEYSTNVNAATPTWTDITQDLTFGPGDVADPNNSGHVATIGTSNTDDVYIQANTGNANANLVQTGTISNVNSGGAAYNLNGNGGYYATINGPIVGGTNTAWLNDLLVNFAASGITAEEGQANFGFRVVNAATGTAETAISGAAGPTYKNWRFNDIIVSSGNSTPTAPVIGSNPQNAIVSAGQPVTFNSSASGVPTPTVQWYEGGTPAVGVQTSADTGGGTAVSGATSPSLTFTTSGTAADNGNTYWAEYANASGYVDTTAATLDDALAAPIVTTQPASVTTTAGSPATFIAVASGSPDPTIGWQVSTNGGTSYTAITNGVGGYTIGSTSGATGTSGSLSFTSISTENNYKYEAVASNSVASNVLSSPATLTLGGTALATWNFSNAGTLLSGQTVLNPGPSSGTGTAASLGMGSAGTYSVYPGDPAASFTLTVTDSTGTYTTGSIAANAATGTIQSDLQALHSTLSGATVTDGNGSGTIGAGQAVGVTLNDTGATLSITGASTAFATLQAQATPAGLSTSQVTNNPDNSNLAASGDTTGLPNTDSANINYWRIVGSNGWNSNAPIGTQGAQFLTSTAGDSSIEASFDLDATAQGEGKIQVQYTTDGSTWTNVPAADLSIGSGDTGIAVANNPTVANGGSANTVTGGYFHITAASSNGWYNNLGVNLTSIAGVNNDANFGLRIVNASTGADCVNITGSGLNNTSGNDRLGDVQITGDNPVAPIILTNPTSQSVANGSTATFTAAATGYPAPTVQWEVSTNHGTSFTPDTTDAGNTTTTLQVVASAANQGYEYEADFTNAVGSTPTTEATLNGAPVITTNPLTQDVPAGSTVTLTAAANGSPVPTVQWYSDTTGLNSGGTAITGATSTTYSFTANEGLTGTSYYAVFTNALAPSGVATTAATVTVIGTPITAWDFNSTQVIGAPSGGSLVQGLGNSPYASVDNVGPVTGPVAIPLGLNNDYTGIQAFPEADNVPVASAVNANFVPVVWRLRGGGGGGAGGSPGVPEGWSQEAPQYDNTTVTLQDPTNVQGAQWTLSTAGYDNVTLHFDWDQGGIADLQPQYYNGSAWVNVPYAAGDTGLDIIPGGGTTNGQSPVDPDGGDLIQATGTDYYGLTSPTGTPTGVTVNLQGIAAAVNNPDFQFRLVTAYSPTLPEISDGNTYDAAVHGQYATGGPGAVNAEQVVQFGGDEFGSTTDQFTNQNEVNGGDFTLTYTPASGPAETTGDIAYSSTPATLASNIQTALGLLAGLTGNVSVAPTNPVGTNPLTDALGISNSDMTVTFKGALAATSVNTLTAASATDIPLTGAKPSITVQDWVNGSASGFKPYVDGGGSEDLANISFNGDTITSSPTATITGLSTVSPPAVTPASTPANTATATYPVTLTSQVYSELGTPTAVWQYSPDGSTWTNFPTSNTGTITNISTSLTAGANNTSTASLTFTPGDTSLNGYQFRVMYTAASTTTTTQGTTLNVIVATAPIVTLQPENTTVEEGNATIFLATATGAPTPIVQWYYRTSPTAAWVALSDSTGTGAPKIYGSQYDQLRYQTDSADLNENGYQFYALFSSGALTTASNIVTMTVLPAESAVAAWNFANSNTTETVGTLNGVNTTLGSNVVQVTGGATGVTVGEEVQISTGGATPLPTADQTNPLPTPTGIPIGATVTAIDTTDTPNTITISVPSDLTVTNGIASYGTLGFDNSPTQTSGANTGSLSLLGMDQAYSPSQPGTGSTGSVNAGDVLNQAGSINTSFNENVWRVRGGPTEFTGGAPANGWNAFAPQYTQGAEIAVPTTGYNNVYVTVDWYSTHSGFRDLQEQYTTNGTTWTNINNIYYGYADDFYGLNPNGGLVPLTIDVSSIPAAQNDPNFGVRFVAPYDPTLSNVQTLNLNDSSNFTLTFGTQVANVTYSANGAQQAANIQSALGALSSINNSADPSNVTVAYNGGNVYTVTFGGTLDNALQPTLVSSGTNDLVTQTQEYASAQVGVGTTPTPGESTGAPNVYAGAKGNWRFGNIEVHGISILPAWLSDPAGNDTWVGGTLTVNDPSTIISDPGTDEPNIVDSGQALTINPTTPDQDIHVGGITLTNGASLTMTSLGAARTHSSHNVLVVGPAGATVNPTFSVDSTSKLDMTDNDLIIHTGGTKPLGQAELAAVQPLAYGTGGGRNGGHWTGNELTSSSAAARRSADRRETTQLAVVLNNDLSSRFSSWVVGTASEALNRFDIIVKYTYTADFSLAGSVTAVDSGILGLHYNTSSDEWADGDTNDDDSVNSTDAGNLGLDFNDGTSLASIAADQVQL